MSYQKLISDLERKKDPKRAEHSKSFFKTGKGEYGEGDIFLGLSTPVLMKVAKKYYDLELSDLQEPLNSKVHEHRMSALVILCHQFKKVSGGKEDRSSACRQILDDKSTDVILSRSLPKAKNLLLARIFDFYLKNTKNINNWDLVDISCPTIVGGYLLNRDRSILYKLAVSNLLWERRIAIISTFAFLRNNQFEDTIKISEILLGDKEDLIHKAVGWVLREVGKRDTIVLEKFLLKYGTKMPRTMLRYAIEKFPEEKRKCYLTMKAEK